MKLAPELLAIRNSLMLHLAFDLGVSANNVCQMPLDKLNEILVDNTIYNDYIDFIIGQGSLLTFASPRDITKPISKRAVELVRSAKRNGIKYETELLFLTKRLHGELIAELETKIDSVTRAFYKVPKSMMPDGHSETASLDKLPDILDIIYDYLNLEYLNK